MDPKKLEGLKLSPSKPGGFKIEGTAYKTVVQPNKSESVFLLPNTSNELKVKSRGTLASQISFVQEVAPSENQFTASLGNKHSTELPKDLKRRHPVYGKGIEE